MNKKIIIIFLFLLNINLFSQKIIKAEKNEISQKTIDSFCYHVHYKKSSKIKVTLRTAFNKDILVQAMDDAKMSEIFDDVEFSQFFQYNVRCRFRFKNRNKFFIGAETMGAVSPGVGKDAFYFGFKKYF